MSEEIYQHQISNCSIKCPPGDRYEEFDDGQTAPSWINGHIQESHPDELPEF